MLGAGLLLAAAGCRSSSDGAALDGLDPSGSGSGVCPTPGPLPFQTQSTSFENPESSEIATANAFATHLAQDLLGASERGLEGKMARAGNSLLTQRPIAGEWVSFWTRGSGGWSELGRAKTQDDGTFSFALGTEPVFPPSPSAVFAILEGDATCALHGAFSWPAGTQVVITDIDGTLTFDDNELIKQVMGDPAYMPKENASAAQMLQTWYEKGYFVVYLSARPHDLRGISRTWLHHVGAPFGPLRTADTFVYDESARTYKAGFVDRLQNELGWEIVAAYGNAESDIQAYEDAGIPKEVTFIVGPEAGKSGTQPIGSNDYASHIQSYVQDQPDATQPF